MPACPEAALRQVKPSNIVVNFKRENLQFDRKEHVFTLSLAEFGYKELKKTGTFVLPASRNLWS